jgi:hypothetical protein
MERLDLNLTVCHRDVAVGIGEQIATTIAVRREFGL